MIPLGETLSRSLFENLFENLLDSLLIEPKDQIIHNLKQNFPCYSLLELDFAMIFLLVPNRFGFILNLKLYLKLL